MGPRRGSRLYRASRELGRVERSLFLLRFSGAEVRQGIRAETTKIEACNDFLAWVSFSGPVIRSGDLVEQGKQLKVACLSPYMRRHVPRFGRCALDMDLPEPLDPRPLPFEQAL